MAVFPFRRKKYSEAVSGGNEVLDTSYNRQAGALKMLPIVGFLTPIGSLTALVQLPDLGATVAVFNPGTTPIFVAFGNSTMVAPTSATDGIPVPAGQMITLAAGPNSCMMASGTSFGYLVNDDAFLAPTPK